MGDEKFALYAMLAAIMSWLLLSNLGIGPALTVRMSNNIGQQLVDENVKLFSVAFWLMLSVSAIVVLTAVAIYLLSPAADFAFSKFPNLNVDISYAIPTIFLIFFLMVNVSTLEAAQLAYQQRHVYNIAILFGTIFAVICVLLAAQYTPNPTAILLAVNSPLLIARIFNALLFLRTATDLQIEPPKFDRTLVKKLFGDGILFWAAGTINNFLCHPFSIIVIATVATSEIAAPISASMNAVIILSSFFGFLMTPFLGAVPNAWSSGDKKWVLRMYFYTLSVNLCYSLFIFFALSMYGLSIFDFWYQGAFQFQMSVLFWMGAYIVCLGIEVTNYHFLASINRLTIASFLLLVKASTYAGLLLYFASNEGQLLNPFFLLTLTNFSIALIPLTILVVMRIGGGQNEV